MSGNGAFKSMPTFETLVKRLEELESCVGAQGEIINYLLNEVQEREFEITFLMNISSVVIPTSKVAGLDGKIPAIRKLAKQAYEETGRAVVVAAFEARQKAERDAENLSQAVREGTAASQESPEAAEGSPALTPGKVTH